MARYGILDMCMVMFSPSISPARDNGDFASSPLKQWFDELTSGTGLCCSFADGVSVSDVDWDTQDGHYRVRLHGVMVCSAGCRPCN